MNFESGHSPWVVLEKPADQQRQTQESTWRFPVCRGEYDCGLPGYREHILSETYGRNGLEGPHWTVVLTHTTPQIILLCMIAKNPWFAYFGKTYPK